MFSTDLSISCIIPTLNAEKYIPALLKSLSEQTIQINELIILDSESSDATVRLFKDAKAKVIQISRSEFHHATTRNCGAKHATGDYLIFMTQDALPDHKEWLANLIKPLINGTASASFARQIPYKNAHPLEYFARITNYPDESYLISSKDIQNLGIRAFFFSNSCSAIDQRVFHSLSGFPTKTIMNEDMLFAARLLQEGYKLCYCADSVVQHSHNYTPKQTFKRYFDIGVVMKQAQAELPVSVSKEGSSYVKKLFLHLIKNKKYKYMVAAFIESASKWLGFKLGKSYLFLPNSLIKRLSMHKNYWTETRQTYSDNRQLLNALILLGIDSLMITLCVLIAYGVRSTILPLSFGLDPFAPVLNYFTLWPALVILIVVRAVSGLYPGYVLSPADELKRQTLSSLVTLFFFFAGSALFQFNTIYSRVVLLSSALFILFFLPLTRAITKQLLAKTSFYGSPVWILGGSKRAQTFYDILTNNPVMGLRVVGYSNSVPKDVFIPNCLVIPDDLEYESFSKLLDDLHTQFRRVWIAPELLDTASVWVTPHDLGGHLTLELKNMLLEPHNELLKRSFDLLFSSILLIALFPLLLLLAVLVKFNSSGSIIFQQERVGRYGKLFKAYKFRTMRSDADKALEQLLNSDIKIKEEWEATRKLKNDPRVTKLGKFLRRSSLDELPQLLNIWKGEMSFVGPRPIVEAELKYYGDRLHLYHQATPGLSGLTQVSGRSNLSYIERVKLDSYYTRNWSIWLDLVIIAKTIVTVLKRKGAY